MGSMSGATTKLFLLDFGELAGAKIKPGNSDLF
jgi:hypothetical protein